MKVYLDYHSTTPIDQRVIETMQIYFSDCFGNPSSAHSMGEDAREAVEKARQQVASLINANPENIYFTNSATEANNVVLKGIWLKDVKSYRDYSSLSFVTSRIEHSSVLKCVESFFTAGYHARCGTSYIKISIDGVL